MTSHRLLQLLLALIAVLLLSSPLCAAQADEYSNDTIIGAQRHALLAPARASWALVTASAQWSPRAGGVVELYPGSIRANGRTVAGPLFLMYGLGVDDPGLPEERTQIWYSAGSATQRGRAWTELIPTTPFSDALSAMTVQDHAGRQFRIFGCTQDTVPVEDIFMSSNGGVDWTDQRAGSRTGPFPPARYHGAAVADSKDSLFIIEGRINHGESLNDVWKSATQGKSWTKTCNAVPWQQRGVNLGVATTMTTADGSSVDILYAMAGYSGTDPVTLTTMYHNDVWMSTNEGRNWIPIVARAPWVARGDAQAEITPKGVMIVTGGYANLVVGQVSAVLNDVWASLDGGFSWGLCSENAEFSDRRYPYTALEEDGTLFVMGGRERTESGDVFLTNDVWKSNFKFDDPAAVAAYCHLQMPACGKVGLQCMPASEGFDQGLWGATCAQCPMLSAGGGDSGSTSSSSTSPLVIALVVFVLAFVLSLAVIVYYYYRLKEAGVDVSKISKQQPWSKAGGSDPLMMDDGHSTVTGAL